MIFAKLDYVKQLSVHLRCDAFVPVFSQRSIVGKICDVIQIQVGAAAVPIKPITTVEPFVPEDS
jgi:hypothetical protein